MLYLLAAYIIIYKCYYNRINIIYIYIWILHSTQYNTMLINLSKHAHPTVTLAWPGIEPHAYCTIRATATPIGSWQLHNIETWWQTGTCYLMVEHIWNSGEVKNCCFIKASGAMAPMSDRWPAPGTVFALQRPKVGEDSNFKGTLCQHCAFLLPVELAIA